MAIAAIFVHKFSVATKRTLELMTKTSPDRRMCFEVDDDGVTVRLGESRSRYAWGDLRRLWRYHDVWLLEIARMSSLLFPVRRASQAMQEFIVARCEAAGVRT